MLWRHSFKLILLFFFRFLPFTFSGLGVLSSDELFSLVFWLSYESVVVAILLIDWEHWSSGDVWQYWSVVFGEGLSGVGLGVSEGFMTVDGFKSFTGEQSLLPDASFL